MSYKISHEALQDLRKIWLYTYENWSSKQADRYFNLIMHEIEYLAKNPTSGLGYGHIRKGYFRSKVKSHLIFYRKSRSKNEIEIIRVLHQMMDIESQLGE